MTSATTARAHVLAHARRDLAAIERRFDRDDETGGWWLARRVREGIAAQRSLSLRVARRVRDAVALARTTDDHDEGACALYAALFALESQARGEVELVLADPTMRLSRTETESRPMKKVNSGVESGRGSK